MLALKKFQPKSITSQPQNTKFWQLCFMSCLVFSVGGLWYETILSRDHTLQRAGVNTRSYWTPSGNVWFGSFCLRVPSWWQYDGKKPQYCCVLDINGVLGIYDVFWICGIRVTWKCIWIFMMLRLVVSWLVGEFCIGLEEARDIPQSESGNWTKTPSHDSKWFGLLR